MAFSNFVTKEPRKSFCGSVRNHVTLGEDLSATGATAPVIWNRPFSRFAAILNSGTSATINIEYSSDGGATWSVAGTFTLDTVNAWVDTDTLRVDGDLVRANVTAINGIADVVGGE